MVKFRLGCLASSRRRLEEVLAAWQPGSDAEIASLDAEMAELESKQEALARQAEEMAKAMDVLRARRRDMGKVREVVSLFQASEDPLF